MSQHYPLHITIPAAKYADHDDCLARAAADFADRNDVSADYLDVGWADERREEIRITVDADTLWTVGNNAGRGLSPDSDDVDEAAEALAADGGEILRPQRNTSEIAIVRTADGTVYGIGGDGAGKSAWMVELVAAH